MWRSFRVMNVKLFQSLHADCGPPFSAAAIVLTVALRQSGFDHTRAFAA
jgi:hypothetical protein